MAQRIYFYSFPANYEDQIALGRVPKLKIGETTQESAEARVHQQMGTATAEKPVIYGEFAVTFTDKQFHTFLRSRGYSQTDGAGTEWFLIDAPTAEKLLYEFAAISSGTATPIRQSLASRPYQQAFTRKFIETAGDFCLFAKCRSGKSVMTIDAATDANYNSLLVVSYRTSAANSWRDDAVTYTKFHEWDVIELGDSGWEDAIVASQKAGRRQLLLSTVQLQSERHGHNKKLAKLYPDGVDLLALDECHIGGESDEFVKLKNNIPHSRLLEISGTAYKTIWKYPRENVFVWGYVEEQKAKAEGAEWAKVLPKMELIFARYNAEGLSNIYGDDPDALKNVFSHVDGKWKDADSVQAFLRQFFAYGTMCRKQEQLLYKSQHIVMSLPSVEACYLFADSLKQFGSQFVPLVITGESGNSQAEILEHVRSNPATICLTVWANVVGVTVPDWDTVIHGYEYESAEFWVQFAFRGGSTRRESWRVIDLAPERAVSSIIEMASVTATVGEQGEGDNVLRTFLAFADVFEFANGFQWLDYNNVLQMGDVATATAKAITNSAVSATRAGTNLDAMAWAFAGMEAATNKEQIRESLNENGTQGSSNAINSVTDRVSNDEKKKIRETLLRVRGAVERLDDVVVHGLLRDYNLSTLPILLKYDRFERVTGCHPDLFEMAMEYGWVNERVVSNAVPQIHMVLEAQLSNVL